MNLDRMITKYNATITQTRLPGCKGLTAKNRNGYSIVVNADLSREEQAHTVVHELCHIVLGHLDDRQYLSPIEKEIEADRMMEEWFT